MVPLIKFGIREISTSEAGSNALHACDKCVLQLSSTLNIDLYLKKCEIKFNKSENKTMFNMFNT